MATLSSAATGLRDPRVFREVYLLLHHAVWQVHTLPQARSLESAPVDDRRARAVGEWWTIEWKDAGANVSTGAGADGFAHGQVGRRGGSPTKSEYQEALGEMNAHTRSRQVEERASRWWVNGWARG